MAACSAADPPADDSLDVSANFTFSSPAKATCWPFARVPGVSGVVAAYSGRSNDGRAVGTGVACRTSGLDERRRKILGLDFDFLSFRGWGARSQKVSGTKKNRRKPQKATTIATILGHS